MLQPWHLAAFSNILLETFLSILMSLTGPSLKILPKTQGRVFPISGFALNPLQTKIVITPELVMILIWNMCHKLNLTKARRQCQKILMMTSCRQIVTSMCFFQFMDKLKPSRSWIPDR